MCFSILLLRLRYSFSTTNLLIFYFFFEWSLIPIFVIIMGWGYQPERLKASLCLLFYTLFTSLPLLIIILIREKIIFRSEIFYMGYTKTLAPDQGNFIIYFFTILAFLVKFPMWGVHLWLPKAHVEAPVAGSIILAGVLLKLGGYGLIRLASFLKLNEVTPLVIRLALAGGGILRVLCTVIRDMKVIIAYSSVVHMALIIAGVLRLCHWGLAGGIIIIIAHGVCSSGIFALANSIYERSHSRSLVFNKGVLNFNPSLSIFWFLLIVSNFGGPFTYNLLGEILLIINLTQIRQFRLISICLLSFFSAAYRLVLYRRSHQGRLSRGSLMATSSNTREDLILINHLWPLFILRVSPYLN